MDAPPATPVDGRRRRTIATRHALRAAVLDLASERDLDAVTVEEIAERAGVSTRTFFNHFDTKEDAALFDVPLLGEEQVDLLSTAGGDLWADLTLVLVSGAECVERDGLDLHRLIAVHQRTPSLIARQLTRFIRLERQLCGAIGTRLGGGPDARLRAEVLAAAGLAAVRVGLDHWGADPAGRPARTHLRQAFGALGTVAGRST